MGVALCYTDSMPSSSVPVRIDTELYTAAKSAGETMSRSTAQQVAHWARIGRALEASPAVSERHIAAVLAGKASYDELRDEEQALVRAAWDEDIDSTRSTLRLDRRFATEGRPFAELDEGGRVAVRRGVPVER